MDAVSCAVASEGGCGDLISMVPESSVDGDFSDLMQ